VAQKTVLGKGLASLFPTANPETLPPLPPSVPPPSGASAPAGATSGGATGIPSGTAAPSTETSTRDVYMGISMVPIDDVQANHYQPRKDFDEQALKELSQSIKNSGIIQPLLVRKNSKDGFELIAGERRLRAAKLAGLKFVPIVIRKSTDRETLELALVENIQRENLNCIDEAVAYHQLIEDFNLNQEDIADRVGKDRATVANYLRLLRLPQAVLDDLRKQLLSFGHGKALLSLDNNEDRMNVRAQILEKYLSVRETEALVDQLKKLKESEPGRPATIQELGVIASRLGNLAQELARTWSTKVEIKGSENKGKIVIHYATRQELDRILDGMHTGAL